MHPSPKLNINCVKPGDQSLNLGSINFRLGVAFSHWDFWLAITPFSKFVYFIRARLGSHGRWAQNLPLRSWFHFCILHATSVGNPGFLGHPSKQEYALEKCLIVQDLSFHYFDLLIFLGFTVIKFKSETSHKPYTIRASKAL